MRLSFDSLRRIRFKGHRRAARVINLGAKRWVFQIGMPMTYCLWLITTSAGHILLNTGMAGSGPLIEASIRQSESIDPFLNVVRALTGSELNNPDMDETALVKRIFLGDGFDLPSILADCQDDPALSRYFSTRDQEMTRRIVFVQERYVRGHVRVNFGEGRLVDKFDNEHGH
jgi:hypothetical protein